MSIPGAITVIGTVPAFAGGTIKAQFRRQGGGAPAVQLNGATISASGAFTLQAWDNSNALYAPSVTDFNILSADGSVNFLAEVYVNTANQDISAAFAGAPAPDADIGSVLVTNNPSGAGKVLTSTSATTAAWS